MTDLIDLANERVARDAAQAIARCRAQLHPPGAVPREASDCLDCGQRIDARRLAVMPFATRCTPCAARHEPPARRTPHR